MTAMSRWQRFFIPASLLLMLTATGMGAWQWQRLRTLYSGPVYWSEKRGALFWMVRKTYIETLKINRVIERVVRDEHPEDADLPLQLEVFASQVTILNDFNGTAETTKKLAPTLTTLNTLVAELDAWIASGRPAYQDPTLLAIHRRLTVFEADVLELSNREGLAWFTGQEREQQHVLSSMREFIFWTSGQYALTLFFASFAFIHFRRLRRQQAELRETNSRLAETARSLREAQREINLMSRVAGMAAVAREVLHSIGTVLNSGKVSAELLAQRLAVARESGLQKAADRLGAMSSSDPSGATSRLAAYISALHDALRTERSLAADECNRVRDSLTSIAAAMARQESLVAREVRIRETFSLGDVVHRALDEVPLPQRPSELSLTRDPLADLDAFADPQGIFLLVSSMLKRILSAAQQARQPVQIVTQAAGPSTTELVLQFPLNLLTELSGERPLAPTLGAGITEPNLWHLHTLAAQEAGGTLRIETSSGTPQRCIRLQLPRSPSPSQAHDPRSGFTIPHARPGA